MTTRDDYDDPAREPDETRPVPPGAGNRPLLLAGLGLTLMLGGYAAMNYVPLTSRQAEQERQLAELRDLAAKPKAGPTDAALSERLNQVAPPWRTPPYQIPGRLAVYGGLFLFVAAGVLMYRRPPAPKSEADGPSEPEA
jgi:hypothetical protein